ncbi:MAG: efflux RND transporter periplasmic adaptor subunit [Terriglobia bacterium]
MMIPKRGRGKGHRPAPYRLWTPLSVAMVVVGAALLASCSSKPTEGSGMKPLGRPAVPVLVGTVIQQTIPTQIQAIGSGEAYASVSVKSQVQGEIQRAYFRPGQVVSQGDLLFTIDPAPFEAALAQAQGNLAKDQAQLEYAQSTLNENTALYQEGIIAKNQYEQYRSNAGALVASVQADKAAIQTATIQLGFCKIRSPISGETGALLVDPGNVIQSLNTALVVINQINPLYVDFSVPQQYLAEIQTERARGPLRVEAIVPQNPTQPEWGTLSFVNNTVDNTTGTILLKGTFTNSDRRLWPGEYVNVNLTLSKKAHVTVAPAPAVQTGQNGDYAYVVKPDHTVAFHTVKTGPAYKGYVEITQGLTPGETVVTDGQLMLYPGAKVQIKASL